MVEQETVETPQTAAEIMSVARAQFEGEGLTFPPVSSGAAALMMQVDAHLFSTRQPPASPLATHVYVNEVIKGRCSDPYTLLGYVPSGVTGSAIHFYQVDETLALFVQFAWSGPFDDPEDGRDLAASVFPWAEDLSRRLQSLQAAGKIPAGRRLVVVFSDFERSGWGFVDPGPDQSINGALNGEGPIMASVDAALSQLEADRTA